MAGRKSKYKPEFCDMLRNEMANGLSFEACCGLIGVARSVAYEWLKRFPEFQAAKEEGESLGQLFWEQQAIDGLWSSKDSKFNATTFIFTMKNRFGWKDRKEISGTGPGGALMFSDLTAPQVDEKIDEILRRLPAELVARIGKGKPK